jgi:putative ABC transport system ATP-binding protein
MKLELNDVSKSYQQGDVRIVVLSSINLKIEDNSSNLILGPSGCGKTTLIDLISLLTSPSQGEIRINEAYTTALSEDESYSLRRSDIGIIRQRDNLLPFLNLVENVKVPQINRDETKAINLLQDMEITELNTCPRELSLFTQQKVALTRALINNPTIILADEPTGELNSSDTDRYLKLLLNKTEQAVLLVVSNNNELEKYFENVFYLKDGSLSE